MLYLYKFTKYVSHNWFHWTLPLPLKGGTTASQGGMTGHTLLLVSLHTSRHCSKWMRLTRQVNAVAGFIELHVQSPVLSPKTFKQLNVLMFANEYLNNALFNYHKRCVSGLLGIHSPLSSLRLSVCLVSHKPPLFRTKESPLNKWNITTKQIHVSGCMYLPQWFFSHILLYNCVSKVIFIYNNIFGQIQKLKT